MKIIHSTHKKLDAKSRAILWLLDGSTGESSKNLCRAWLTGRYDPHSYPRDSADAMRCVYFLQWVPEATYVLDMLSSEVPEWDRWRLFILAEIKDLENEKVND